MMAGKCCRAADERDEALKMVKALTKELMEAASRSPATLTKLQLEAVGDERDALQAELARTREDLRCTRLLLTDRERRRWDKTR